MLISSLSIQCMHRQLSSVDDTRSPYTHESQSTNDSCKTNNSDEEDICDAAITKYASSAHGSKRYLKPVLRPMMQQSPSSPDSSSHDQAMYEMIVKAMHAVIEEREQEIREKEQRIKEKYSGKKTAAISALTATIATIVSTICTTIVTINSK